MRLQQPGQAGHQAEIAVGQEVHGGEVHAHPPRRLDVAAHGVELPAGGLRVISSQVSRDSERHHQDRQGDPDQVAVGGLGLPQDDPRSTTSPAAS